MLTSADALQDRRSLMSFEAVALYAQKLR